MQGQRLFTSALTMILMFLGAVLGDGKFPVLEDGKILSPELLISGVLPIGFLFTQLVLLFKRINQRVIDPDDPFEAGDLISLLKAEEFWVALFGIVVGILSIFGVQFIENPESQVMIVNMMMGIVSFLLYSWTQRPNAKTEEPLVLRDLS